MVTTALEDRLRRERLQGIGVKGIALGTTGVASAAGAYVGSLVGEGLGYLVGQTMDALPVLRDLAPQLAERTGLLAHAAHQAQFNADFYRTVGAGAGALCGIAVPALYLAYKWVRLGP